MCLNRQCNTGSGRQAPDIDFKLIYSCLPASGQAFLAPRGPCLTTQCTRRCRYAASPVISKVRHQHGKRSGPTISCSKLCGGAHAVAYSLGSFPQAGFGLASCRSCCWHRIRRAAGFASLLARHCAASHLMEAHRILGHVFFILHLGTRTFGARTFFPQRCMHGYSRVGSFRYLGATCTWCITVR